MRLIRAALAPLPYSARLRVGSAIGWAFYLALQGRRRIALANLRKAYPEQSAKWREDIAKRSFQHLGRISTEILFLDTPFEGGVEVEGWEHLETVTSDRRGYFLMSAHFGNWELGASIQAARGHPVSMIVRPLDNPLLDRLFSRIRESNGNRLIQKRTAVKEMVKSLKAGGGVAIVIDQNFRDKGADFVPFFGTLAATTPVVGAISVRMDIPIIPVFIFPLEGGGYKVRYEPPIRPRDPSGALRSPIDITTEATGRIEKAIRECPYPWFWMHNRWASRPPEENARDQKLAASAGRLK